MKKHILIFTLFTLLFLSCSNEQALNDLNNITNYIDCKPGITYMPNGDPKYMPYFTFNEQKCSIKGKYILCFLNGTSHLIDYHTGKSMNFYSLVIPKVLKPGEKLERLYNHDFCPYDEEKLMFAIRTNIYDSIAKKEKTYVRGYTYNLANTRLDLLQDKDVTGLGFIKDSAITKWYFNSKENNDTMIMVIDYKEYKYHLQTKTISPLAINYSNPTSYKGDEAYVVQKDTLWNLFINSIEYKIKDSSFIVVDKKVNISGDGTKIILAGRIGKKEGNEYRILDLSKNRESLPYVSFSGFNIKAKHCMITLSDASMCITPFNTAILTMHRDGDYAANLYEVNFNGDMIRQITR